MTPAARATRHTIIATIAFVALLAMVALWAWSPLGDAVEARALIATARRVAAEPLAPLVLLLGYAIAGVLVVPLTIVMGATVVAFGAWPGTLYAMIGANVAASIVFFIGRLAGRDAVERWLARRRGSTLANIEIQVTRRGILSIALIRLLPMPFALVNAVAGASTVTYRDFVIGTVIGLVPVLTLFATASSRLDAWLEHPDLSGLVPLGAAVIAMVLAAYGLRTWARRRARQGDEVDL